MPISSLPRSTPQSQGVSSTAVLNFLDDTAKKGLELHSFMLVRHGQVIAEGWWNPYRPDLRHSLFSLSKSFTATAIGIAVEEGLFRVSDRVIDFFPKQIPRVIDDHLRELRIKHLLTMSTGHAQDPTGKVLAHPEGDWVKAFFACPLEYDPGTHFVYNTAATYMLSAILQTVAGEKLIDYLTPRLFEPLGIVEPTWEECPKGINTGGFGLNLRTEDIAKFGQLFLNRGRWHNKQLVPKQWITEASRKQIDNYQNDPNSDWQQGYGYQMWMCRHGGYRGDGMFGQFCVVLPEQDAVVAITAGEERMHSILQSIWDHLLPAFEKELPQDDDNYALLKTRLESLSLPSLTGEWDPEAAARIDGEIYELEPSELGITSLEITAKDDEIQLTGYAGRNQSFNLRSGVERTVEQMSHPDGLCLASAAWEGPDTLRILARFIETPFSRTLTLRFTGNELEIEIRQNCSFGPNKVLRVKGRRGRNRHV